MISAGRANPALRFPGFTAPWKLEPLSYYLAIKGKRNAVKSLTKEEVLSVSGDLGIVNQIAHLGRSYAGQDLSAYHVVDYGDVVYTKSPLKAAPYGIIRVNYGPAGIVSTLYAVYTVKASACFAFVGRYFELDDRANAYLRPLVNKGAKNDMKISSARVLIDPVAFPELDEQRKIAAFLAVIDERIKLLQRNRAALERYKRGMMKRLFAQTLRFKRDDGTAFPDWVERTLGSVFDWIGSNSLSREMLTAEPGTVQNIHYGDIHGKFPARFKQREQSAPFVRREALTQVNRAEQFCLPGDVVIADASEDYADIGKAIEIIEAKPQSLVAGLHTHLARPKSNTIAIGFSGYLFQSWGLRNQMMRIAQGISVLGISKPNLSNLAVQLPHLDEQRKIAGFLSALDDKIAAVAVEIAAMQTFKKGLLQQMFV